MLSITPATAQDADEVYHFITALEGEPVDRRAFDRIYRANLRAAAVFSFVARQGQQAVGFVSVSMQNLLHHGGKVAEMQELFVLPSERGNGVGSALFDAAQKAAAAKGCLQLEVSCRQSRLYSHRFYEKHGMQNTHYKFTLPL